MATVGEAVIAIVADSKAFDRTLKNLGTQTSGALERGTRGFVERANVLGERFGARLGQSAGRFLRRGLLAASAGIAAAVGATLVSGFRRFTTIEDATATLTLQLGNATDAAKLLNDVLGVVEGTPFALDQFVDAARNLVAASIPLEKVPRVLEAIADGAAASGGSAQDVDNVVNALGRLATGAELTLGPIRDLEEQGVPALRILANRAGKSTTQMAKDITKGTVSSQKAIDDLVEGIINGTEGINGATVAFGGAAKNVGNTVSGAFSNLRIAVARAGAKVIQVFADSGEGGKGLVDILNSLRDVVDTLGERAEAMAERFVGSKGFGKVLAFFEELPKRVEKVGVVRALVEGLRKGFEALPPDLLGSVFATIITKSIEGISRFLPAIIATIVREAPAIIAAIISGLLTAARENPLDMAIFIGALGIPGVAPALAAFFGALPFGSIVAPLIRGIGKAITAGFSALGLGAAFQILGDKLALGIVGLVLRVGPAIAALAGAVATGLAAIAGVALGVLLNRVIERFFPQINRALEKGGAAIFDFFVDHIFPFFTKTVPDFFTKTIPHVVGAAVRFFAELPGKVLRAIVDGFGSVFAWFRDLGGRIVGAIGDLGGALYQVGRNLLIALKNGAVSVYNDVIGFFSNLGGAIFDSVANALDIFSPSKKFMFIGTQVVEGLRLGIEQSLPRLAPMVDALVPKVDARPATLNRSTDSRPAGLGMTVNNYITEVGDGRATAERIVARMATA